MLSAAVWTGPALPKRTMEAVNDRLNRNFFLHRNSFNHAGSYHPTPGWGGGLDGPVITLPSTRRPFLPPP